MHMGIVGDWHYKTTLLSHPKLAKGTEDPKIAHLRFIAPFKDHNMKCHTKTVSSGYSTQLGPEVQYQTQNKAR